ncbi:MAG: ATP-dependent Clp protease adaptor ClpS [Gemmataceae bacterium]
MSETVTLPDPKVRRDQRVRMQPRYHVILLNDDDHTYEYVIEMLAELFKHPIETGFQMAKEVDEKGRVIVMTTSLELAELKQDQVHAYGPDPRLKRSQGSMTCELEPAE